MIDYFKIIHKYIKPDTKTYKYYLIHVTLVTKKALTIATNLKLKPKQLEFIEEAGMLHDIGICKVNSPILGCNGTHTYMAHVKIGKEILLNEKLPKHAEVAYRHNGVGICKEDIMQRGLPLPFEDILPQTLEQKIIAYSDLFFTKNPKHLWNERTHQEVLKNIEKYNFKQYVDVYEQWKKEFEGI